MPVTQVQTLLGAIAADDDTIDLDALVQQVVAAAEQAPPDQLDEAVAPLLSAPFRDDIPPHLAGPLAILGGCLIEYGADASKAAGPVVDLLERVVDSCCRFLEACADAAIELPEDEEQAQAAMAQHLQGDDDERRGIHVAGRWIPPDACAAVAETMPADADVLGSADPIARAAVAVLTRCPAALSRARGMRRLREQLEPLSESSLDASGMLHWLAELLLTLDDHDLVVLHPPERKGYLVRVCGVADNMQLQQLLGAALIGDPADGWLPGTPPRPEVVANARGEGPQEIDGGARGLWNVYWWAGLRPDTGELDVENTDTWVWNEGVPADIIPLPDGTRVLLLGPPTIQRSMNACRRFDGLQATVEVIDTLTEAQVDGWIERLRMTPRDGLPAPRTWSGAPRLMEWDDWA